MIDLEFGRFADPLSEHLVVGFAYNNTPVEMRASFERGFGPLDIDGFRVQLYMALDLAWFAPLLAMQGEPTAGLLQRLVRVIDALEQEKLQ